MANLIAFQSGNFNAANFKNADTATNSAQTAHTFANFTNSTTTLAFSPTFSGTNGASNDGVLMFVGRISAGVTGTYTVGLSSNATSNNLASCTVNVADIPLLNNTTNAGTQNQGQGHWMFFKWGAPVVLATGVNYQITVSSSVNTTIQTYRSATTNDWTRLMRLSSSTTTPAAADVTYIVGDWTAGGTVNAWTITVDTTTAITTNYGACIVTNGGILQFGTSTFTNYRLKLSGNMEIYGGGQFIMGNSGTPMPETTNALLEFQSASAAQFGMFVLGGSFTSFGARTGIIGGRMSAAVSNKALTTNVATLTTSVVHGFATSDTVVITGVDSVFDGTYTIASTPTTTTFTYAKVNANVGSTAVTPLGSATTTTTVSNKALTSNIATLTTAQTHGFTVNSQTVTNKQLVNNVATITTSAAHNFSQIMQVYVNIGDATFDGLQTIVWCPSSTTFQFQKTAANVTSTAASGTATVGPQVIVAGVDATFNGTYNILTVPTTTTFTYAKVAADVSSVAASGTATLIKERWTKLAADRAAGGAAITLVNGTGWAGSDQLAFASTTRTSAEHESRIIGSISGTAVTVTANFTNAHAGTTAAMVNTPNQDIRGEVLLLSKNVKVGGLTTANSTHIFVDGTSVVNCQYTQFYFWGSGADRYGFSVKTSAAGLVAGSFLVNWCAIHDNAASGYGINMDLNTPDFITVTNTNFYQLGQAGIGFGVGTTGTTFTFDNLSSIRCGNQTAQHGLFLWGDAGFATTNCMSIGGNSGMAVAEAGAQISTHTNWVVHGNDSFGFNLSGNAVHNGVFSYFYSWRNNSSGYDQSINCRDFLFQNVFCFGNNVQNFSSSSKNENIVFRNIYADAGVTLVTANGWAIAINSTFINNIIQNIYFGTNQAHATSDFNFNGTVNNANFIVKSNNISLSSPTPMLNIPAALFHSASWGITRWTSASGVHRTFYQYGTILSDTVRFKTASPSEQLSPTAVSNSSNRTRLESSPKRCAINSGNNTTVSVWVRTSVIGDGATYNGNRARLILKANPGAGFNDDLVLATATVASDGAFEQLSGLTPTVTDDAVLEFVVDCTGTAGWINVDDWAVT